MLICTLGDLVLDVIVRPDEPLVAGDDVVATTRVGAGGQAANVAAWAVALGARARFVGHRGDDAPGRLVQAELARHGVESLGPAGGRTGVIVAVVGADRDRSMASDRGSALELTAGALEPRWFAGSDWLHVSGYMLAHEGGAGAGAEAARLAHAAGARVSVDAASATLIQSVGAAVFASRLAALVPDLVFGTESELAAIAASSDSVPNTRSGTSAARRDANTAAPTDWMSVAEAASTLTLAPAAWARRAASAPAPAPPSWASM